MCRGALQLLPEKITMMNVTFSSAKEQLKDPLSCFKLVRDTRNLRLSPKYVNNCVAGIREQLDAQRNLFSHSLDGVMIAYSNIRRMRSYGTIVGSQPCIHVAIKADFIVFQPEVGKTLKGKVNKVFRSHVGCLVHSTFNASIPKQCRDGDSLLDTDLQPGQDILFKVVTVSVQNGMLSINGCFFNESFDLIPNPNDPMTQTSDNVEQSFSAELSDGYPTDSPKKKDKKRKSESEAVSSHNMASDGEEEKMETTPSCETFDKDESLGVSMDQNSTLTDGEERAKKKKKKHKRKHGDCDEETETQPTVLDTSVRDEVDSSGSSKQKKIKSEEHEESVNISKPVPTPTEEEVADNGNDSQNIKKKKKKKKSKEHEESVDYSEPLPAQEEKEISENGEDSQSIKKKKKKKKHKHSE